MEEKIAQKLLEETKTTYNLIAEKYSQTRKNFSPLFKNWLSSYLKPQEKIFDWGCAHGYLLEILPAVDYYGGDISEELIKIARKKYPQGKFFLLKSPVQLPFPDNFFDKIVALSVFHHLPSKKLRLAFLKEAKRVLKEDGLLILTVWNFQPIFLLKKGFFKRLLILLKYTLLKILGLSPLDFKDIFLPFFGQRRYLHCFSKKELEKLACLVGLEVEASGTIFKRETKKEGEIFLIARKPKLQQ